MAKYWDTIVIGAGAAGLMCALIAGRRGRSVLVLEKSNKVGKKILMSGGGRCNFTNLYTEPGNFLSQNPHFCKSALSRYTQWDFIDMVNRHEVKYHEKTLGQLFCDHSSKDILNMLTTECALSKVEVRTHTAIDTVIKDHRFSIRAVTAGQAVRLNCESLVIASGGLSVPTLGGSDFGYRLARQFGHRLLPLRAGLVPFTFTDNFKTLSHKLSGVSIAASVGLENRIFDESILFSHRGLSGPAILQISNYWQEGQTINLNILPRLHAYESLIQVKHNQPRQLLRNVLAAFLPRNLVLELESLWWPDKATTAMADFSDQRLLEIATRLNCWTLKPAGTEGYRTAEVTLGGVDTNELSSKTMMSKLVENLYFIGEIVDVTGHLGGFNFQWAWSSAHAAAQVA